MDKNILKKLASRAEKYMQFETDEVITWCSNCGNYGIQNALKRALTLEGMSRRDFFLCFDIGCNGNGADKIEAYTIHGLHGRALAVAAGAAIANEKLKIIASAGDGATFSEGVNHLVHSVRNNYPVMFIFHNNENYGLTTGQASALTRKGACMNGTPDGVTTDPINPLQFVLSLDPTFVARSFSADPDHMTEMFRLGLRHDGFAFIEILQACPSYNHETPQEWYATRVRRIEDKPDYDCHDIWQARKLCEDVGEEFYLGLLYENKHKVSFMKAQKSREGRTSALVEEVQHIDISDFLKALE